MIEGLFIGLAKVLGSTGVGTIFGGIMGWLNRKVDLEAKRLEYADKDKQRAHELLQRDKDALIMEKEWAGRERVAAVEGAAQVEQEQYKALAESYKFAEPEKGSKMAAFASFVRPFVSIAYFILSSVGGGWIIYYAFAVVGITLSAEQWFELVMFVVSWVAFMAGATIGWWYAMRPGGRMPTFGRQA